MIAFNLFMFWGEQQVIILLSCFFIACLSFLEIFFLKNWQRNLVTTFLVISSLFLLKLKFSPFLSTESVIALILLLSAIKLFELKTETDYFHLFLILNLVLTSLLILKPTFLTLVYSLLQLSISFYFVLKLNKGFLNQLNIKRMLLFFAPALPMGLLFFFIFPRFTSGFNQMSNPSQSESGYSDRIDLNLLRPMSLSTQSIFKVKFKNANNLKPNQLYWRGSVLWETDGLFWTPGNYSLINHLPNKIETDKNILTYEIFMEPGNKGPIFLLDHPHSVNLKSDSIRTYLDGTYEFRHPMYFKNRFQAQSQLEIKDFTLNQPMTKKSLRIRKSSVNDPSAVYKRIFGSEKLSLDQKIDFLNNFFKSAGFIYSLEPPVYNSMDEFLDKKIGYCSHFAAAYAYIARTAGIPSRVISGFQGGEYNPYGDFYRIEAKDSHAWVEIYKGGIGWIRIDPTEFINPGRILLGARQFNQNIQPYYEWAGIRFEKKIFSHASLDILMKYIDYLNSNLSMFFFDFDYEYQKILSEKFKLKREKLGMYSAFSLIFFMFMIYFILQHLQRKNHNDQTLNEYQALLKELEKRKIYKFPHEGPQSFQERIKKEVQDHDKFIHRIDNFIKKRYGPPEF
jgi:hypothetical protein